MFVKESQETGMVDRATTRSTTARIKSYFTAMFLTALASKPAGREITIFPDDVFIVSYLRSGSTWARFLFGNLLQEEPVTFANVNRIVPTIYDFPDRVLRRLPRTLKSHECFDPRYPRVIHIVRDPRDVAVSFYYYNLKVRLLPDDYAIDDFVSRFVAGKTVDYADRLGCWEDHTLSWLRMRQGKPGYQMVRYEDLLSRPDVELRKIIPLLGVSVTPEKIANALKLSSADRMRALETKQAKHWRTTKDTRQDIPFVRVAKSGSWRERLPEKSVRHIEAAWGSTIQELGYPLAMEKPTAVTLAKREVEHR